MNRPSSGAYSQSHLVENFKYPVSLWVKLFFRQNVNEIFYPLWDSPSSCRRMRRKSGFYGCFAEASVFLQLQCRSCWEDGGVKGV